jgi:uncharacterized protein YlxW (UPF0749 family)
MTRRGSKAGKVNLTIIAASVLLGFMLSAQFRSTDASLPEREQSRLATADTVRRLEVEQRDLKERISILRTQIAALQRTSESVSSDRSLAAELEQQRMLTGLVALRGPGVVVTLDDSARTIGLADDANNYIIHDYEVRDVVSLLWLSSAEGISINGERLVNLSSLYCVGSTILVNDTRLSPPYEVRAIGDSALFDQALQNPKNLAKLRARVKTYGIQFKVSLQKEVVVPAFGGDLHIRYARPTVVPPQQEQIGGWTPK